MENKQILALVALIVGLVAITNKLVGTLTKEEIEDLAKKVIAENKFDVDYKMIVSMAKIESNFKRFAFRYETHLNDASMGLMQTLLGTAQWLAKDMGYAKYGIPSYLDLSDPEKSIYYGCAYVNWLSNYRGVKRGEQWIVESYNGGPGRSNSQTQRHWKKYQKAKGELYQ